MPSLILFKSKRLILGPGVFVAPPSAADFEKTLTPAVRRLVRKFDPAERDARKALSTRAAPSACKS